MTLLTLDSVRRNTVAAKSFQQEVAEEMAGKAMMWGPAVAGGLALGPVGAVLGAIVSVVIVASGSSASREGEDQSKHK
jgi:hypothetical protein